MNGFQLSNADARSLDALIAVDPAWVDLATAREAFGLADRVILHAGPPCRDGNICKPILNSAAMAALYEGWAKTEDEARNLIVTGQISLRPAQDHGAVVPLASVLTRSMAVHVVADARNPDNRCYAPLNGGSGPALRLGIAGPEVVDHLKWLNSELAQYINDAAQAGFHLIAIADEALTHGDDCHGRTIEATRLLVAKMANAAGAAPETVEKFFESSPSFFLNLWMAACKCMLAGAIESPDSSVVVALGGNGVEIGLKVAGLPDQWFTAPALPPVGALEPGSAPRDSLGAIGDSAVVDVLGLGAMAMHHAPAQQAALGGFMPEASAALGRKIMPHIHSEFSRSRLRTGLTARRVAEVGSSPAVSLGIIHREGLLGRIGGGISVQPIELFTLACEALRRNAGARSAANI